MSRAMWVYRMPVGLAPMGVDYDLPDGAQFRHAEQQHGQIAMWFEVDPAAPAVRRRFRVVATGPAFDTGTWLATLLLDGGHLVLHLLEGGPSDVV